MKKIVLTLCALIPAISAFADYDSYDELNNYAAAYARHNDEMSGFEIFALVVIIAYIILSIVILIRWWRMTTNVEQIRQQIIPDTPSLAYLVAIGENEKAQKVALKLIVDNLYTIYTDQYIQKKAKNMDIRIQELLPQFQKLGLSVPEYVTTGEKFIDYMNGLTGKEVKYQV